MAWEWSHTAEAYRDAELNLRDLPAETIRTIWAEWESTIVGDHGDPQWIGEAYPIAIEKAKAIPLTILADEIWVQASEYATCTNGGWEAYMCPYGCGCHNVPFDRETPDSD